MGLIRDKVKARRFMDGHDEPLTMRRTRDADGEIGIEIYIVEATDNLIPIVEEAARQGLIVRFDGHRVVIEEPPEASLPEETTEVVEEPLFAPIEKSKSGEESPP